MPPGGIGTHKPIRPAAADLVYEITDMKYRRFGGDGLGKVDKLIKTKYVSNKHHQNLYLFVTNLSRNNDIAFDYRPKTTTVITWY